MFDLLDYTQYSFVYLDQLCEVVDSNLEHSSLLLDNGFWIYIPSAVLVDPKQQLWQFEILNDLFEKIDTKKLYLV